MATAKTCPRCEAGDYGRTRLASGVRHVPTTSTPSDSRLERMLMDDVVPATDGCRVEPDGHCEHGHSSWLLVLRLI